MMARDVFVVHVSIIPSESCFNLANMILTNKCSRLGAKTFERLVCLKDWFDAEQRNQYAPVELQLLDDISKPFLFCFLFLIYF
jgi:hAT family C-terminal dimerisation region